MSDESFKDLRDEIHAGWKEKEEEKNRDKLRSSLVTLFFAIRFDRLDGYQDNLDLFSYAHLYGFLTVGTPGHECSVGIKHRIAKNSACAMGTTPYI